MLLYKLMKHIYEKTRRDIERWREFRKKRKDEEELEHYLDCSIQ